MVAGITSFDVTLEPVLGIEKTWLIGGGRKAFQSNKMFQLALKWPY
jgi:hypothetical protein